MPESYVGMVSNLPKKNLFVYNTKDAQAWTIGVELEQ